MKAKENVVMCAMSIVLAVSLAASGADDFPSFRTFGPYCVVTGEETPERPTVMGPTGAVAWRHGRCLVKRTPRPGVHVRQV